MKIIFKNGTELEAILVTGGGRRFQGAHRETLTFVFSADTGLETIDEAFAEEACKTITAVDGEDGGTDYVYHVYEGYSMRCELKKESVEVDVDITEDRISITMAQKTYMETQIADLQETVDLLVLDSLS